MDNQSSITISFKTRLLLLASVTIFIINFSITALFVHIIRSHLMDDFLKEGKLTIENARVDLFDSVAAGDNKSIRETINKILQGSDVIFVRVYNHNLKLLESAEVVTAVDELKTTDELTGMSIGHRKVYSQNGDVIRLLVFTNVITDLFIGRNIGFVQVGISLEHAHEEIKDIIMRALIIFLCFMILGISGFYFYAGRFSKPLDDISSKMSEIIIKSDLNERLELNTDIREIELLKTNFNLMLFEMEQHRKMQVLRERMEKEFEIARMIQTTLLPELNMERLGNVLVSAEMIPADEVGGDYFDVISAGDGRRWYGIGDVTGHGLIPGMIMMMVQTVANTLVGSFHGLTPKELIVRVNRIITEVIRKRLKVNHYMTLAFVVDHGNGHYYYAGSHLDFIVYRKSSGRCETIKTEGVWIGIRPDISKSTFEGRFALEQGDCLVLFSDGIIEAMNGKMEQFGLERLIGVIEETMNNNKDSDLVKKIINEVKQFMEAQKDDLTVLAVRYDEPDKLN